MTVDSFVLGGRYVLENEIGRGGMGVVFKARDQHSHVHVAVKALDIKNASSHEKAEIQARFEREARMSIGLKHPQIVAVHDFISVDQRSFLIMELLKGHTLKEYLEGKVSLTPQALIRFFIQCCDGFYYAHQQGIIHRDIKPDNLFITHDLHAKIMDFGVARQNNAESFLRQTVPGMMMGTLNYMSPEQLQDTASVDQRTDIFSMGVVLYEAYTGHLPFHSESMGQTIVKILSDEPVPPQTHQPQISKALSEIILKAMNKRRGQRYQSFQEMAKSLMKLLPDELPENAAPQSSDESQGTGQHWQRQTLQHPLSGQQQMTQPGLGSLGDHLTPEELQAVGAKKTLHDRDTGLKIECEPDGLQAWLSVEPTLSMEPVTLDSVHKILKRAEIRHGIIQDEIAHIISENAFDEKIKIAQGEAPVLGQNAYMEYLLEEPLPGPQARADGSVDHRELKRFQSVSQGTPLMKKYAPVQGRAGMSIYGKPIHPQPVRDLKLLESPGTSFDSESPLVLISTTDGMPTRLNQSVRVDDLLELQDVGPETGHIRFDGSVIINGNVSQGYRVESGGDVIVYGTVENAQIFCGGNLYLHSAVYGGKDTQLKSKYHMHAQFIQNADIDCGGDLQVIEGLFHCQTHVVGKAYIGAKKGRGIVNGGELYSSHAIQVNQVGTVSGTQTQISLGRHPRHEVQLQELQSKQAILKQQLQNNIKDMIYQRTQGLKGEKMQQLEQERTRLMFASNTLTDEIQFLDENLKKSENPQNSVLVVKSDIHPGVKVNLCGRGREFFSLKQGPVKVKLKGFDARDSEVVLEYV